MTNQKRILIRLSFLMALVMLAPSAAVAGDQTFSSVVKHIKSNYRAKQQGFFGAMMLARIAVKVIRPAGVKNFKVALLKNLDYSEAPGPQGGQFHSFIRGKIDPRWSPLVQYSSTRERQWSYVYIAQEKDHVKLLAVVLQRQDAVVLQTKFSPEKLAEFMNNPQIMGISLNKESRSSNDTHTGADSDENDEDEESDPVKAKPPVSKPPA